MLFVIILSFFDILLTYYTFFLETKKGLFDSKHELAFIQRLIINGGISPLKYIISAMLAIGIMILAIKYNQRFNDILIGGLVIVNFMHIANINYFKSEWNNDSYWKLRHEMKEVG